MKCLLSACILLILAALMSCQSSNLNLVREWRLLDFAFPDQRTRDEAIRTGLFVQKNAVPIDVDVDYQERSRMFVTIPRFDKGIPITLGTVSSPKSNLIIQPYPDYSYHSSHGKDCNNITSAFRVAIDQCHLLWVLDSGKIGNTEMCPPTLFVFDLRTDRLVNRYRFPADTYLPSSLFITPILDVKDPPPMGRCENTKVYIADVSGFGLVVYDLAKKKSWRIQNKLLYPYPNFGTIRIAGDSFDLMDGVFGLSVSPQRGKRPEERVLYFHSLASGTENSVPLCVLNNDAMWSSNMNAAPRDFKVIGSRGIQTAAQAMDSNGNLFFVLMDPIALVCWDSSTAYNQDNIKIVVNNDATLQFASGLKIVRNLAGQEEIWVMTNRFQKIATESFNSADVNFRVQFGIIKELLHGSTKCKGKQINNFVFPTEN